jgi:hypothetical protein
VPTVHLFRQRLRYAVKRCKELNDEPTVTITQVGVLGERSARRPDPVHEAFEIA